MAKKKWALLTKADDCMEEGDLLSERISSIREWKELSPAAACCMHSDSQSPSATMGTVIKTRPRLLKP